MSGNLAVAWNNAALAAVRDTRTGPPIVARALHVLHASMYDAWAAHDDHAFGTRLGDRLRRPPAGRTREAKREAVSYAAHLALADLFPTEATTFAKLMGELGYDPDGDVKLFFALTGALLDASIACWDAKRTFDSVRPVTAVHSLFAGKEVTAWAGPGLGTRRIEGEDWQPYIATPPFPEYISGHSTFSSAPAVVLARFTGSDRFGASATIPAGSSRVEPGATLAADVTLRWATFTEAAALFAGHRARPGPA